MCYCFWDRDSLVCFFSFSSLMIFRTVPVERSSQCAMSCAVPRFGLSASGPSILCTLLLLSPVSSAISRIDFCSSCRFSQTRKLTNFFRSRGLEVKYTFQIFVSYSFRVSSFFLNSLNAANHCFLSSFPSTRN